MSDELAAILEECLSRLEKGESLTQCLQDHPAQAEQIGPLLEMARQVRAVEPPAISKTAFSAGRAGMLVAAAAMPESKSRLSRYTERIAAPFRKKENGKMPLIAKLALSLASFVVASLGGWGISAAANDSLPGDLLYPVKVAGEQIRLQLTSDDTIEDQLELDYQERRREEVLQLLMHQRVEDVRFFGVIDAFDENSWTVDGIVILIGENTEIKGEPYIGADARVEAETQDDGTLLGLRLSVIFPDGTGPHGLPGDIPHGQGPGPDGEQQGDPDPAYGSPEPSGPVQEGYMEPANSPQPDFTPTPHGANAPGYQEPATNDAPGGNPGQSGPNGQGSNNNDQPGIGHSGGGMNGSG